jgi:hypothetical protein
MTYLSASESRYLAHSNPCATSAILRNKEFTMSTVNLDSTTEMNDASTVTQLQVVSVPPLKVADTERVVSWSRRNTEKTPVPETERYRAVVVAASTLKVPNDACHSPFYSLLQSTIHDLADATFQAWVRDNMLATTMDAGRLSLDKVLAFWAEEKQRTTVDAEKIIAFLKTSATFKGFATNKQKTWLHRIPKIAAPAYRGSIDQEDAAAIIAQIHDDDLADPVAVYIIQRCNNILTGDKSAKEAL